MFKNSSGVAKALLIGAAIFIVVIGILPWTLLAIGLLLSPNPLEPAIKYAEFPFEVVYEINGETKTVNDVFV